MHVGTIIFQGLFLFGLTMIALNLFVLLSFNEAKITQPPLEGTREDTVPIHPHSPTDSTMDVIS